MRTLSLAGFLLACVLNASGMPAQAQPTPHKCPTSQVDTSAWLLARDEGIGIEIKRPPDYREIHWGSRSDTSGAAWAFWRDASSRIEFNEFQGFYKTRGPNPTAPACRLEMRSGVLDLHIERTTSTLSSGRDTLYFLAKGIFRPLGKPPMLVEIGALDSTEFLEQFAALRTIRFLRDR